MQCNGVRPAPPDIIRQSHDRETVFFPLFYFVRTHATVSLSFMLLCRYPRLGIIFARLSLGINDVQDRLRPIIHQHLRDLLPERDGLLSRRNLLDALRIRGLVALDADDAAREAQPVSLQPGRLDADGDAAAALERAHDAALRLDRQHGSAVLERLQQLHHPRIIRAHLEHQPALPHRVQHAAARGVPLQVLRDAPLPARAVQAGGGQDQDRVLAVLGVELADPRVDVAAHVLEPQLRVPAPDLRHAPHAARAHDGALGQVGERLVFSLEGLLDDDDVARVLALGEAGERAAVGQRGRRVLGAVHDDVQLVGHERGLELVRPQALAPELVQRRDLVLVRRRQHAADLEVDVRVQLLERRRDPVGLDQRQLRLSRADPHEPSRRLVPRGRYDGLCGWG